MKKICIIVLLFFLTACGSKEPYEVKNIEFNGEIYQFLQEKDGYDVFTHNGHIVEVQYGTTTTITTEINEDIYIIIGSKYTYTILKNGTTILICEDTDQCTGFETVPFQDDIIGIILEYEKE